MRLVMTLPGFGPRSAACPWLLAAAAVLLSAAGCGSDGVIGAPLIDIAQVDAGPDAGPADTTEDVGAGDTLVQLDGVLPPDAGTETADSQEDTGLPDGQTLTADSVQEDVATPDAADVAGLDSADTGAIDANQDDAGLPDVATMVDATADTTGPTRHRDCGCRSGGRGCRCGQRHGWWCDRCGRGRRSGCRSAL
jgi:hypothetical protein